MYWLSTSDTLQKVIPKSKIYVTMKHEAPHAFNMGVVNKETFVGEMFTSVSFHL